MKMEKRPLEEQRMRELIRAASARREVPPGLEKRIMAQVRLRERRRRERRAVAEMACCCAGVSAALVLAAYICLKTVDLQREWTNVLLLFAGIVGMALTTYGDRVREMRRRL